MPSPLKTVEFGKSVVFLLVCFSITTTTTKQHNFTMRYSLIFTNSLRFTNNVLSLTLKTNDQWQCTRRKKKRNNYYLKDYRSKLDTKITSMKSNLIYISGCTCARKLFSQQNYNITRKKGLWPNSETRSNHTSCPRFLPTFATTHPQSHCRALPIHFLPAVGDPLRAV